MSNDGYISVTRLLERLGYFDDYRWVPPEKRLAAMRWGEEIASATEFMDRKGIADHWNPEVAGCLKAWALVKKEFGVDLSWSGTMIEQELKEPYRRIKGRIDRRLRCLRKYGGLIVVEITTGDKKPAEWKKYQTALYEYMVRGDPNDLRSTDKRWAILLRPDETYVTARHCDPNDLRRIFKRWKEMSQ